MKYKIPHITKILMAEIRSDVGLLAFSPVGQMRLDKPYQSIL